MQLKDSMDALLTFPHLQFSLEAMRLNYVGTQWFFSELLKEYPHDKPGVPHFGEDFLQRFLGMIHNQP